MTSASSISVASPAALSPPEGSLQQLRDWGGPTQMSALEAAMWLAEANPWMRSTVTGVMVLDGAPDWDRLVAGHQRLTHAAPRLRQRVAPATLGCGLPQWEDDPGFLLDFHLRRARLPGPGTLRQLLDCAQNLAMTPFDRSRPPWETTLVEGLEGGRSAIVMKLHHILSDGIGITQLMAHAFTGTRETRGLPVGPQVVGSPTSVSARPWLWDTGARVAGLIHAVGRWKPRPPSLQESLHYLSSAARLFAEPVAKGSPILSRRSRNWRFDELEVPLVGLKAAATVSAASLNDVFLAGVMGGLRRYHEEMGAQIDVMPLAFPISLRKATETAGGNHFSAAQFSAPVGERDVRRRIALVHDFVQRVRREPALDLMERVSPLLVQLPSGVLGKVAGRITRLLDAQISNVPGSPLPVYVAGAKVLHNWGFGPAPGCALMIGMTTYAGACSIGITSDQAAVIEPELLVECLRAGLQEVIDLGPTSAGSAEVAPPALQRTRIAAKPARRTKEMR